MGREGDGRRAGMKWQQLLYASLDLIPVKRREAATETSSEAVASENCGGERVPEGSHVTLHVR